MEQQEACQEKKPDNDSSSDVLSHRTEGVTLCGMSKEKEKERVEWRNRHTYPIGQEERDREGEYPLLKTTRLAVYENWHRCGVWQGERWQDPSFSRPDEYRRHPRDRVHET